MSIEIIEENPDFLVLFKPHGVSVHNEKPSLSEFLQGRKKPLHFVNRLDLETSGLVVIAQKPELQETIAEAMELGSKFYRALLCGKWKSPSQSGQWEKPLTDKAEGFKNPQGISANRVPCVTKYQVIRSNDYFTEVEIELLTGRQHQIRKHTALSGQAILGDNRYGNQKHNDKMAKIYGMSRMQLQAENLVFDFNGKKYNFKKRLNLDHFFMSPKI